MGYYLSLKSKMRHHRERSFNGSKKVILGEKSHKTGKKRVKMLGMHS